MEDIIKITQIKNLNKLNFNTTLNIPIDANTSIKTLLDVDLFLFDQKVECGNGKAIISGKIGAKVLYIDTDNITNTLTESISFSETYQDGSITNDTYLNVFNSSINHNVLSTDGTLKINCNVNINPIAYLNLPLKNNVKPSDILITKKSELTTKTISQTINTKFDYTSNLETKDNVTKILYHNCYFTPEKTTAQDNLLIVEGKMVSSVVYESNINDDQVVKEIHDVSSLKYDIEITNLEKDAVLDLSFKLDRSVSEILTEFDEDINIITIKNQIMVCGVCLKNVSIDIIDDVFSTINEVEATSCKREYTKYAEKFTVSEVISNETSLQTEEPAIDEVIANLNIVPEVTNTYVKDSNVFIEGLVSSNLIYIDENKAIQTKQLESPFIINTKIQAEKLDGIHVDITVIDNRVKVKRGTIVEMEYSLFANLSIYEKCEQEMVDNLTIGKQLDFSKYDFQIFIAKQNESIWDLCKRIKISPNDIYKYNKELPLVMQGGEKIVIKR